MYLSFVLLEDVDLWKLKLMSADVQQRAVPLQQSCCFTITKLDLLGCTEVWMNIPVL
jgi:hypothetical protein